MYTHTYIYIYIYIYLKLLHLLYNNNDVTYILHSTYNTVGICTLYNVHRACTSCIPNVSAQRYYRN